MPIRITPFVNNQFYHVYNRGVEKRIIFTHSRDYKRFLLTLYYYQFLDKKPSFSKFSKNNLNLFNPLTGTKQVEIIAYCFMPNHYHLLIKQVKEGGVSKFIKELSNSYTKHFNTKYARIGPLFQGSFKAVLIESDEQLVHLSRYIHLNPVVSKMVPILERWQWSSYFEYSNGGGVICSVNEILNFFPKGDYLDFIKAQIDYGITLETIKHQTIDSDDH